MTSLTAKPLEGSAAAPHPASVTVARNALFLLMGQAATTALGVVVNALLGRSLGAADFGLLFLVTSISALPYVVVEWGQTSYVVAEVARRRTDAGELIGTSLALRVAGGLAACVVTATVMWLLGYDLRTRLLATALVLATLPLFLAQGCTMAFRGHERMDYDASTSVLAKLFAAAIILPTLLLGGRVLGVIVAQGLAGVATLGVAFFLLRRLQVPRLRATLATSRELLAGGAPLVVFSLGVVVQQYVDAVVISKLASVTVVGCYGAARTFGGVLVAPVLVLGASLYPRLSLLFSAEPEQFRQETRAAMRPLLTVGMLTAVGTYLFADVAVALVYSKKGFGNAVVVLQAIAPSILLLTMGMFFGTILNVARRRRALALAKVVSIVVGVPLAFLLIPWSQARFGNGGIGAALVSSGVEVVMLALCLPLVPRGILDRRIALDLGRAVLAGAGTIAVGLLCAPLSPWVRVPAIVLVFGALSALVGLLRKADVDLARTMFRRRKGGAGAV